MIRHAFYSGTWYPSEKSDIEKYVAPAKKKKAIAAICPHAGWIYSGNTAGKVFSAIDSADIYVVIGPNHRGEGPAVSVYPEGAWQTPLGILEIDSETAAKLIGFSAYAKADITAHTREHSLEVQMPFIKLANPSARIVPVCMYDYRPEVCKDIGMAVAKAILGLKGKKTVLIIASTDMSHYVSASFAKETDGIAIEKIVKLDPSGLLSAVDKFSISMCGAGPVASALWASIELGAAKAGLEAYSTSGDVTGDNSEVVGYAGMIIT